MTPSLLRPSTGLVDLSAPAPGAGAIHVTDSYELADGDSLSLNGGVGFKLEVKNGSSVSLDIAGTVDIQGHHDHTGGVVSSSSTNGDATVTIAGTGSLTVVSTADGASVFGMVLTTRDATVANGGAMHVVGDTATGIDIRSAGAVNVSNTGTMSVEAGQGGFGYGVFAHGASLYVSNGGSIAVSGGAAIGIGALGGEVLNTGDISVTGTSSDGFAIGVGMSALGGNVFTNDGEIHVQGLHGAIGADLTGLASAINHGLITAETSDPLQTAVGVRLGSDVGGLVQNFGTIEATYAVAAADALAGFSLSSADTVINLGTMRGAVLLGGDNDIYSNQGVTRGDVYLGDGDDSFDSSAGRMRGSVYAGVGDDTLIGSGKADVLNGDEQDGSPGAGGADLLRGMGGADSLLGGDGADTLIGGAGGDTLVGGDGDDVFKFNRVGDSTGAGIDQISDLTDTDVIDLRSIDADTGTGGDQGFAIVGSFTHHAGELTLSYDSANERTVILGDVDGDASGDLIIIVSGDHTDFTNFVF